MMTVRTNKIVTAILNGLVVVGSFQALMYLLKINQVGAFVRLAEWIWLFMVVNIVLMYDLHFKPHGTWSRAREHHETINHWLHRDVRAIGTAFWERIHHFRKWEHVKNWLNYLLLPTLLFWATVTAFYLNFSFVKAQQIFFTLSSIALILNYWYLKELFHRKLSKVDNDVFVALSIVKIYTATITYGTALGIMRSYCLAPRYYVLVVLAVTFLLIHQALFQQKLNTVKNLLYTLLISVAVGALGYIVYSVWGYNYYTAAIFVSCLYNFLWGIFHYHLDHALTKRAFYEILLISALIASMVLGITNFRERLLDGCQGSTTSGYQF